MRGIPILFALALAAAPLPLAAQQADPALAGFEQRLGGLRAAPSDELLYLLRRRVAQIIAPLPGFTPGTGAVEAVVERAWPELRRRCGVPGAAPLGPAAALTLADAMLREAGPDIRPTNEGRGALAALVAALDGRLCRCTHQPSLALAADCAS
jgi:hypothetical protein